MKKIILASQSPRRKELLKNIGINFETVVDDSLENFDPLKPPEDIVMSLSEKKAVNVRNKTEIEKDCLIIAADTVVVYNGEILGKPRDEAEAFKMLKRLSGNKHFVYTGLCILDTKTQDLVKDFEKTEVYFREISDGDIEKYISTGEPMDKAGAYGIQGLGSLLVEKINGDYFNIVGLPVCKLGKILKSRCNINIF